MPMERERTWGDEVTQSMVQNETRPKPDERQVLIHQDDEYDVVDAAEWRQADGFMVICFSTLSSLMIIITSHA